MPITTGIELTDASAVSSARRGVVGTTTVNNTTQTATQDKPRNPRCILELHRIGKLGGGNRVAAHHFEDQAKVHALPAAPRARSGSPPPPISAMPTTGDGREPSDRTRQRNGRGPRGRMQRRKNTRQEKDGRVQQREDAKATGGFAEEIRR